MLEAGRQLLVAIVKGHGRVERIMEGFLEIGVGGATVIDAKGMGQIISTEMPIFSGFRSLFPSSGEESYMVMSVIDDDAIDDAVNYRTLVKQVIGLVESSEYFLIEKMAAEIAKTCLSDQRVERVHVSVEKPGAVRFAKSV